MTWRVFEAGAPEMAEFARQQFEQSRVAMLGTIRRDGSPRISCIEPCIVEGELYLGMMWQSLKAQDLRRDPRLTLHNAICSSTGDERELSLRGRAVEIRDPDARKRYAEAVAERIAWTEPHFHLFAVDIEHAALVEYGRGEQSVKLWPQGTEFKRPYG
jgi:predicted pyridoxine 5'-phosphate oxidase superfamily flavin-nucleotide-binding protein